MAEIFSWRHGAAANIHEPAPWVLRRDDFSVQVSLPADALFWVRIELPVGAEVRVSDCKRSLQTAPGVAQALALALAAAGDLSSVARLRFLDIAPARGRIEADREAAQLALVLAAMFPGPAGRVAGLQIDERNGKSDLVALLSGDGSPSGET